MMPFLLLYVTHPSRPEAIRLSSELLNAHLVACVNYYPTESMYWWEGRLTKSEEVMTIYKTTPDVYEQVKGMIEASHKSEVPCIIRLAEVSANASYEKWVHENIQNL